VLNAAWKLDSFQTRIFVYVCSTGNVVELKTLFETWIERNIINGVYSLHVQLIWAIYAQKSFRWNEYTPFTSFPAFQVWNRLFSSNKLNVEQTYTNIIICILYEMKTLFASTNWIHVLALGIQLIRGQHCARSMSCSILFNNCFGAGH
jgi:hypothetical protein